MTDNLRKQSDFIFCIFSDNMRLYFIVYNVIDFKNLLKLSAACYKRSLSDFKIREHWCHSLGEFGKVRKETNQVMISIKY